MYCTRLKQAQSDEEREAIREEMRADTTGGGAAILEALEKTQTAVSWAADRTGAFQSRVRKEAKALGAGTVAGALVCLWSVRVPVLFLIAPLLFVSPRQVTERTWRTTPPCLSPHPLRFVRLPLCPLPLPLLSPRVFPARALSPLCRVQD